MSVKSIDVRTPGYAAIAKKWNLSMSKVIELVNKGAKVEQEHTKSLEKAKQIARDHIAERPDYYKKLHKMEKSPIEMNEENVTGAVRGLGYVTGDPGVDPVSQYTTNNAMSYSDINGSILKLIKDKHNKHLKAMGFSSYDPTATNTNKVVAEDVLNELGSMMQDGMPGTVGITDPPPKLRKNDSVDEGKKLEKAKKAVMAGITAANIYTLGDVAGKATEGRGSPKRDIVAAATTLPGAAGWGATGVHYAKKAYDYVKRKKMNEEKNDLKGACWKGYTAKGLKKKGGKMVPNCVPVEEGWALIGRPFTKLGDRNPNAQFYGGKPKQTTTKNDEKDNTYKNSKQGGTNVNKVKPVKEDAVTVAATQHMDTAQSGYQQSAKPSRSRVNLRGTTAHVKGAEYRSGTGSARASLGAGGQMKPTSTNVPTRFMRSVKNAPSTQGAGGQLKPSSTSGSSSFTPNSQSRSMNVGKGMAASKQTSPVVKGMSAAGQEASKKIVPKAASVMATVGKAARALSGPEGAAVTAAAEPLAKKMASSYKAGHQSFASHGSEGEKTSTVFARMKQPSQGRSVSQYEKDVLTPKASEAPKAPENPKVDAPTPPSRPDYFTHGQAFGAARKEAGGGEGKFSYQSSSDTAPKTYQTNVSGEKPEAQLKPTSVKEDWQSVNRKDKTDGLSQKAVNAYKRENPGSKLQTAVTEKNPSGKRAARRKSFCSRMSGMKARLTSAKTARDPDSNINKALRRWNCEEQVQNDELKKATLASYIKKASDSRAKHQGDAEFYQKKGVTNKNYKKYGKALNKVSNRRNGIHLAADKLAREEVEINELEAETLGSYTKKAAKSRKKSLHGPKPDLKTWSKRQQGIQRAISRLTSVEENHNSSLHEETKMDNKVIVNEAIENILDGNLNEMKENLLVALQEKTQEKLEERKKIIASQYFGQ
jgi:hypothetical protein